MSNTSYPVQLVEQSVDSYTYLFQTDKGNTYILDFVKASHYFKDEATHLIYDLTFYPVENVKVNDSKVGITIKKLIRAFMYKNEAPVMYICDNHDTKHQCRAKLFARWFNQENNQDEFSHKQSALEFEDYTVILGILSFEWDENVQTYFDAIDNQVFE